MIHELAVQSRQREQLIDITPLIQSIVEQATTPSGQVLCFVPHTTAGITINENADPDVTRDILYKLHKEIPQQDNFAHAEGNSDAHIKASLMGFSLQLLFEQRHLILGRWQAVYFCEFDGPRNRTLIVRVVPHA